MGQDRLRSTDQGTRPVPQTSAGQQVDEDVRRSACDRCRGQKLRCERIRYSIHTPLRDIACRRCIKARVRCTISSQSRVGRSQEVPKPSIQHTRQLSMQHHRAVFDQHTDAYCTAEGGSSKGEDSSRCKRIDNGSCDEKTQPLHEDEVRSSPKRRQVEQGSSSTGSVEADHNHFHQTDALQLFPNMLPPFAGASHGDITTRGLYHRLGQSASRQLAHQPEENEIYLTSSRSLAPLSAGDIFLPDFESIMEQNFDSVDGSGYFDPSPPPNDRKATTPPSEINGESSFHSHSDAELWPKMSDSGEMLSAASSTRSGPPSAVLDMDSSLANRNGDRAHVQLVNRLTQLTATLLQNLEHCNCSHSNKACTSAAEESDAEAELSVCQASPISKLLWNAECFVGLLNEATTLIEASCSSTQANPSGTAIPTLNLGELATQEHSAVNPAVRSKQRMVQATAPLSRRGIPSLTTMMAVMATYSCVLQVYEHVFSDIQRALLATEFGNKISKSSPSLLPLFQVDSLKLGGENSLRVHIAMDVSLQMLKQIESRMSDVLDVFGNSCSSEETKACMLALLQSLTYNGVSGSAASVSSLICDIINSVRCLFTSEGKPTYEKTDDKR